MSAERRIKDCAGVGNPQQECVKLAKLSISTVPDARTAANVQARCGINGGIGLAQARALLAIKVDRPRCVGGARRCWPPLKLEFPIDVEVVLHARCLGAHEQSSCESCEALHHGLVGSLTPA